MKISGALPKGDADGISAVEPAALKAAAGKSPRPIVALVILEPAKIDEDLHTREKELKVSIRRIEALLSEDMETATRLLQRSYESRTGESTLPIELENDIKDALKGVETYVPETSTDTREPGTTVPDGGYQAMTVKDLRALLKERTLNHSPGTKTELVNRLKEADEKEGQEKPSNVTSLFSDGSDAPPPPADIVDDPEWDAADPSNAEFDAAVAGLSDEEIDERAQAAMDEDRTEPEDDGA